MGLKYAMKNTTGQSIPTENNGWNLVIKGLLVFKLTWLTFIENLLCTGILWKGYKDSNQELQKTVDT